MRLDKFLSATTDMSRREARSCVKRGRVTLNGAIVKDFAIAIDGHAQIHLNGELLSALQTRYLMLNKPSGYVCTWKDAHHPPVQELLELPKRENLQVAGRLDADTTGLVLLTDDGSWNHWITSPRRECWKVYRVDLADKVSPHIIEQFAEGVLLHGERKKTLPAKTEIISDHCLRLTLQEGRYHQVKRMCAATGNRVTALHREAIGGIVLDNHLSFGEFRTLSEQEIASVTPSTKQQ